MKIDIDWFVPYANAQEYNCARGCASCSSAQRKDHPAFHIDEDYYKKLSTFIEENSIEYKSISLNCCGDFLENFAHFQSLLKILHQYKILKKWTKILAYTSVESLKIGSNYLGLLEKFNWVLEFQIGIPYRLSDNPVNIDAFLQMELSSFPNIHYHIVLQQSHWVVPSEEAKNILIRNVKNLAQSYPITLAESEGQHLAQTEIEAWSFLNNGLQSCPFATDEYMKVDKENMVLYMFDISDDWLRPHGPGCEKNPHLMIWSLDDDIGTIHEWAKKLQGALKKLNNAYSTARWYSDICNFCRNNIHSFR